MSSAHSFSVSFCQNFIPLIKFVQIFLIRNRLIIDANGDFHPRTCFTAGTKIRVLKKSVAMKIRNPKDIPVTKEFEELVNIEDLRRGDYVLSWNEKTGRQTYSKVTDTYTKKTDEIYTLTLQSGEKIETTWNQSFRVMIKNRSSEFRALSSAGAVSSVSLYSAFGQTEEKPDAENSEWREARRLKKGDVLFDSIGRQLRIRDVSVEKRSETVYNFTVEGEHDYYVGEDGVLVHNQSCGNPAEGLLGNDNVDTSISAGSGRPVSQLFEKLKNFITGEGFNSDGELALKKILAPNKSGEAVNERTVIEIGGTKMIREAGSDRITMMLQGGETFTLNGPKDLERIINAAGNGKNGNSVTINNAADFNELLSRGVENYYAGLKKNDKGQLGGNPNIPEDIRNKRMNSDDIKNGKYSLFNFDKTNQFGAGRMDENGNYIRKHPDGTKLTYQILGQPGIIKDPDEHNRIYKDELHTMLCNQFLCGNASATMLLKSYGLVRPDATVYETAAVLNQDSRSTTIYNNPKMVQAAEKSDWAKLTGAYQLQHMIKPLNDIPSNYIKTQYKMLSDETVQSLLAKGHVIMSDSSYLDLNNKPTGHVSIINSCGKETCRLTDTLAEGQIKNPLLKSAGLLFTVDRKKK